MNFPCHRTGRNHGFSALELILVLLVASIVLAVAIPSFKTMGSSTQVRTAKNALILGLQRARAEALSTGRNVVLCPSSDQHSCRNDSDWSEGWLLYRDDNRNGRFDPVEQLLLSQQLDPRLIGIRSNTGRRQITYRNLGESAGANASFVICSRRDPHFGGQVIIANSGRVRSLSFAPLETCAAI